MTNNRYLPEGKLIGAKENRELISSIAGLEKAMEQDIILESTVLLCDSDMNLHVNLGNAIGIIEKQEALLCRPDEEIKDIALITRVGKPVCFKVLKIERRADSVTVKLSRRAAQMECVQNYLSNLSCGDIIPARVTHTENFGAFIDIGCGIISLLSVDCISVSRISHPQDRLLCGTDIFAVVKTIDKENGRIYVTHRELLGTWEENAALFSVGQTVAGIIRSIESYGIFIELTPNLAGLAELRDNKQHMNLSVGQSAAVYIKNIIPERMKIKLVLIDSQDSEIFVQPPKYFIDTSTVHHMDFWRYSPIICSKTVQTVF